MISINMRGWIFTKLAKKHTVQIALPSRSPKSESLCTDILTRLLARGYDAITRVYHVYIILYIRGAVWMGGAGGVGDGLAMVSRVSL